MGRLPKPPGPRSWRDDVREAALEEAALPEAEQRRNAYVCPDCGGFIVTVDRHEGVTPMFLTCRAGDDCRGQSVSCMYRLEMLQIRMQAAEVYPTLIPSEWPAPTWEWYAPRGDELRRIKRREPNTAEHVRKGGLLLRRIEA